MKEFGISLGFLIILSFVFVDKLVSTLKYLPTSFSVVY